METSLTAANCAARFHSIPNANNYRHGNTITATAWGARRITDWMSLSGRLLFSHEGHITGSHPDLNPKMSPSHRPDFRGGTRLDIAISRNLLVAAELVP